MNQVSFVSEKHKPLLQISLLLIAFGVNVLPLEVATLFKYFYLFLSHIEH
jgi:hypothetical protein